MKKTLQSGVMAALCLFLWSNAVAQNAGTQTNPAIKEVKIGQRMPDVLLTNLYNYKTPRIDLADLQAKLIILDFWATWCTPCVSMMPKMDSLQQEYQGDVQFISVSYQTGKEVSGFMQQLEKRKNVHYTVPYATDDNQLRLMFPHKTLPHYVWISANGTVIAITGAEEITGANLDKMMGDTKATLKTKEDLSIPCDYTRPLFVNGNGGSGQQIGFHNILGDYVPGLRHYMHLERANGKEVYGITVTNCPLLWLYKQAYGDGYDTYFPPNRVLLDVNEPKELSSGIRTSAYMDWIMKPCHGVCYELRVPVARASQFYPYFRQNLELLFPQYMAQVEKREVKCLALVCLPGTDKIKTRKPDSKSVEKFDRFGAELQNGRLKTLVSTVKVKFMPSAAVPLIDQTGYTGRVDLKFSADLTSIADMNRALEPYGLQWQEKLTEMDMLVIKDTPMAAKAAQKEK
jgi:thiol-disulfide isomerase/thioredoxin